MSDRKKIGEHMDVSLGEIAICKTITQTIFWSIGLSNQFRVAIVNF